MTRSFYRRLTAAFLLSTAAFVSAQSTPPAGFVLLKANRIQNATGGLLATGTLDIQPTDANNLPIEAVAGGVGGQIVATATSVPIMNGAIPAGTFLADSALTSPTNITYRFTIRDSSGAILSTKKGVQPTSAATPSGTIWCSSAAPYTTCNLDQWRPNVPNQAVVQYGPAGAAATISNVLMTVIPSGSQAYIANEGSATNAVLHLYLPAGPAGNTTLSGNGAAVNGSLAVGTYITSALPQSSIAIRRPESSAQTIIQDVLNIASSFNAMSFSSTGVCDDEAIDNMLTAALTNGGHVTLPAGGACTYSKSLVLTAPSQTKNMDFDFNGASLTMTGTGGGTCGPGTNGLIQLGPAQYTRVHGGFLKFTNAGVDCVFNHSTTSDGGDDFVQGAQLDHLSVHGVDGTTSAIGFYNYRSGNWHVWDNIFYNGFRNCMVAAAGAGEQTDIALFDHNTCGPSTTGDYLVRVYGAQAAHVKDNNLENSGVLMGTSGSAIAMGSIEGNSMQDGCTNGFALQDAGSVLFENNFQYSGSCASGSTFLSVAGNTNAKVVSNWTFGMDIGVSVSSGAHAALESNVVQSSTSGVVGSNLIVTGNTIVAATPITFNGNNNYAAYNALFTSGSGSYYAGLETTTGNHVVDQAAFAQAMASGSVACAGNVIESPSQGVCEPSVSTKFVTRAGPIFSIDGAGCSFSGLVGGSTSGGFTASAACAGAPNLTMGGSVSAPHGWSCSFNDQTTLATRIGVIANNATTVSFQGTSPIASGDYVTFTCDSF